MQFNQALLQILEQKNYTPINPIGKGGSAHCFLVKSKKYNMNFVCKEIPITSQTVCKMCELEALQQLNNPGIIRLYDFEIQEDIIYLFLEFCPFGSLQDLIKREGFLKGNKLFAACKSILASLDYIHTHHFAHLDIKPSNILIDRYGRLKLADFGIAKFIFSKGSHTTQKSGTILFMSPELIKKGRYDPFKADIWALGITFYYLASGKFPWDVSSLEAVKNSILAGSVTYPPNFPTELKPIIASMVAMDPERRPTPADILNLDLFKNLDAPDSIKELKIQHSASHVGSLKSVSFIKQSKSAMVDNGESNAAHMFSKTRTKSQLQICPLNASHPDQWKAKSFIHQSGSILQSSPKKSLILHQLHPTQRRQSVLPLINRDSFIG